jgi:integrating conjugative element protein (TIGR03752 family)
MQWHRSNRLLPILGIAMVLVFVLVLQRACRDSDENAVLLEEVPSVASPDADTPADTITTLTANVAAMTRELKRLEQDNTALKNDNRELRNQRQALEAEMATRIAAEIGRLEEQSADDNAATLDTLNRRIDTLADSLTQWPPSADTGDLPIGFGFDKATATEEWVWIEPLDAGAPATGNLPGTRPAIGQPRSAAAAPPPEPHFTVPRNATLLGSRAMTAMLGRVPMRGEVRDPMPFKVLTGTDNLAANGYAVPGVAGMVWSGTAIGDWTLSCVRGELHSVTFIFADGSIRTISSDESRNQDGNNRRALGWISDANGVPCVSGARKSNAGHYLSQRIGARAVQAAADAAAAAQTSTVIRDSGSVASAVDGELGPYVVGRSLADGSAEIAQWLAERQAQSFDAVFVPAGAELVIHVDRELAIDLDSNARKLHYAASSDPASRLSLD